MPDLSLPWLICDLDLRFISSHLTNLAAQAAKARQPGPAMVIATDRYLKRLSDRRRELVLAMLPDAIDEVGRLLESQGGMLSQRWRGLETKELRDKAVAHLRRALKAPSPKDEPHAVHGAVRSLMLVQRLAEDAGR